MKVLKFPDCECEFDAEEEKNIGYSFDTFGSPMILYFSPNIEEMNMGCRTTWDLISEGNTKGVFQLESRLGQMLAKRLKPRNIEHLAALISIMRPGVLEAMRPNDAGKMISVTDHYILRKNGEEEVTYFHPALEKRLGQTYGEMIYQEQAMQIARDIAGFDLQQADILRKAIGKKKASIMAEVKKEFLEGTKKVGIVEEDEAQQIFEWIEKSQRYSFNKAHAVSYAINGYLSAYAKAHFKRQFLTSYLFYSYLKQKPYIEINELVNNCKVMDIDVKPPDLRNFSHHFKLINKEIFFGLTDIKGVGSSVAKRLDSYFKVVEEKIGKPIKEWVWADFLIFMSPYINKTAVEAIIKVGSLRWMKEHRQRMLFDFQQYSKLSKRERDYVENMYLKGQISECPHSNNTYLDKILYALLSSPVGKSGGIANKNRVAKIQDIATLIDNPPMTLEDSPTWISAVEEALLGIPITCTIVDECDKDAANTTCRDFRSGITSKAGMLMAVKVDEVKEISTKRGKNAGSKMAFITVSDSTASLESVVLFPDIWPQYKAKLFADNTIMLAGHRGREKDSFVVTKVWQI